MEMISRQRSPLQTEQSADTHRLIKSDMAALNTIILFVQLSVRGTSHILTSYTTAPDFQLFSARFEKTFLTFLT